MKYEFSTERAKRKKRKTIIAILLGLAILIAGIIAFNHFSAMKDNEMTLEDSTQNEITMQKESTDIETNHNRELEVKDDVDNSKQEKQEEVLPVPVTKNAPQYTLHIDKSDYKLVVLEQGKIINTYDIAVGKNPGQKQRPGDLTTPTGEFTVDEVLDASYWTHDFQDGKGEIAGAYGPWFISLETGWDGIGIHGTHDPASIKTMVSEGCIRMHNADLEELLPKVVEGTKVIIEE